MATTRSKVLCFPTRCFVILPVIVASNKQLADGEPVHTILSHEPDKRLAEACGLARAIDLDIVCQDLINIHAPRPATLFGSGKIKQLLDIILRDRIELVIVDHALSPIQQRNLEKAWCVKVLDRTGLILEIFGRRARTREGCLQVELAHLTFERSRLVRSWTHLERQRGGFGFLGGPGETQIETDRRLLQARINKIEKELAKVTRTRGLHRKSRRDAPYPTVAIVGYTNAGKSTLFNILTNSEVFVQDQVFATLDPTMRALALEGGRTVILSDTVGFISDLPTTLIAAFRATLEEVVVADLILHVRDVHHVETEAQRADVECVLSELNIDIDIPECRIIEVWNKIDLLSPSQLEDIQFKAKYYKVPAYLISACSGNGIPALRLAIAEQLGKDDIELSLALPFHAGRLVNWLYENTRVISLNRSDDGEIKVVVRIAANCLGRLRSQTQSAGLTVKDTQIIPGD
ncbi:MAG: GTPase HflX [Hyphomicrobiaceae bacterium]|nr:GTPase HflX [Hyphomicrobiaceae bacterium]